MARVNFIQTNFTSGAITPKLRGRVDITKYSNGVRELLNFVVTPYGGVTKRPGFKYVGSLETQSETGRLIPFEFSNEQAYILEFTDGEIRFYRNQALILQSRDFTNGDFASDISGWTDNSNGTGTIAYSSGTMQLTGAGSGNEAIATQALTYLGIATYTVSLDITTNSIDYKVGTTDGGSEITSGSLSTGSQSFNFTPTDNYDNIYITFEFTGTGTAEIDNVSLNNPVYKIKSPYALADLSLIRHRQISDVIYFVHEDYKPRKLIRRGNDKWDIEEAPFIDGPYLDENTTTTTITPSATTGDITLTASADTFVSTDVGRHFRYKSGPSTDDAVTYTGTGSQTNFDIPFYPQGQDDVEVFQVASTGVRTLQTYTTDYTVSDGQVVMVSAPSTSDKLVIQPKNAGSGRWGYAIITAYTSATEVDATVQIELQGTNASTEWRLGAWSETTGYPRAIALHQQRLWLAGSTEQPQTVWGSVTGVFENFSPDDVLNDGSIADDTALNFTVASDKAQTILWMSSQGSLLLGTSNNVHSVIGSNLAAAITAQNIAVRNELNVGCHQAEPLDIEEDTVFIQRLQRRLQSTRFSFSVDGYESTDLTLLSEHFAKESPLKELAYQDLPDRTIWALREDGVLLSCAFMPSQEVIGWSKHTIGGSDVEVESIATIPGDNNNELYVLVKRTIDGNTTRYVEVLTPSFDQNNKDEAFFVDSGLTYEGSDATTISGLDHLEGETLRVLSEGSVHPNVVVSSGQVTLQYAVSKATLGLPYDAEIETNFIEAGSAIGTAQTAISRIHEVGIRFLETLGGKIGYSSTSLNDIIQFRSASDRMDSSPPLFTGDKIVKFPNGQENGYKVYLKHDQPTPCTILALIFKATVSDR